MTRRVLAMVLVIAGFALGGQANAATGSPAAFVETLGDRALTMLRDETLTLEQREARFRTILREGFDLRLIGRFVIGRYWKQATDDQRSDYLSAFGDFIVRKYSTLLGGYAGESFTILSETQAGENDFVVRTRIEGSGAAPIEADWRVRERKGEWRIIDIVVEGISMAVTQRAEFSSVVRRNGIDGLIQVLAAQTSKVDAVARRD
jgi:phospholipid transport system substrate-binding protein